MNFTEIDGINKCIHTLILCFGHPHYQYPLKIVSYIYYFIIVSYRTLPQSTITQSLRLSTTDV